jgi:hypothetical protein
MTQSNQPPIPNIVDIWSADVPSGIEKWVPDDPRTVVFSLQMEIGPVGGPGADIYEVLVATPLGLATWDWKPNIVSRRALIVLRTYSFDALMECINEIFRACADDDWTETNLKLQRYFHWEFEDYIIEE